MGELLSAAAVLALLYAWVARQPTPGGFVSGEPWADGEDAQPDVNPHPVVRYTTPEERAFLPHFAPCPKCQAFNRVARELWQRYREGDGHTHRPRVPSAQVRWSDGALHCRTCDLTFYPVDDSVAVERYFPNKSAA